MSQELHGKIECRGKSSSHIFALFASSHNSSVQSAKNVSVDKHCCLILIATYIRKTLE